MPDELHDLPPAPRRPISISLARLNALLGLNTLRGRFVLLAGCCLVFILTLAAFAYFRVGYVTGDALAHGEHHRSARRSLESLVDHIWLADNNLRAYLLTPDTYLAEELRRRFAVALEEARQLRQEKWVQETPGVPEYTEQLSIKIDRLRRETDDVLSLRVDPNRLFVAMPTMLNHMLPAQARFNTAASLAMDEAVNAAHEPGQTEIYRHFAEIRYLHAQMIGAFRLWLASRAGAFGLPETAMRAQSGNIKIYLDSLDSQLKALETRATRNRLGLQQEESLRVMRTAHGEWLKSYREVVPIYASDRWRNDSYVMQHTITPLFTDIWMGLRELEELVEKQLRQSGLVVNETAQTLSASIWIGAAIGLIATILGFVVFERNLRRPITEVTKALRAEAAEPSEHFLPPTMTTETNDLIEAFNLMREEVHSRQERLANILDNAAEGIITFDENGIIEGMNLAAQKLFGYAESDIRGNDIATLFVLDQHERRREYLRHFIRSEINRLIGHEGELTGRHHDGATFPVAVKVSLLSIGGRKLYTGLVADISERKALVERLRYMAEHDGLTGLYNRTYVQDELERLVDRIRRGNTSPSALLYIDLDNFKYVNDSLGHGAGDRLLIEVAGALHRRARRSDLIARIGGDEFVVLLYSVTPELAMHVAEAFRARLAEYTFNHEGERADIGCSIGVAPITAQTVSASDAFAAADLACHLAKRAGRNRTYLYNASDAQSVTAMTKDMGWSRRIKEAITHNRFVLACQPIVETRSGRIDAYEVLIRMCDDNGCLIMPNGFLPAAERFGLMVDIDQWVIRNAIETLAKQRREQAGLRYSINLSAATLMRPEVCDMIQERLAATGLTPNALTFEVTETVAVTDLNVAISFLGRLRQLGCRTALDDFGSGMSSFAYLRDLPVDQIKIDGRFVRKLAANPLDQAIVRAMNDIAHALGKETVAEFVEDNHTLAILKQYGVDYAQGYYLGRPEVTVPCDAIAEHAGMASACALPAR